MSNIKIPTEISITAVLKIMGFSVTIVVATLTINQLISTRIIESEVRLTSRINELRERINRLENKHFNGGRVLPSAVVW